jgi:copper homeostasis protein
MIKIEICVDQLASVEACAAAGADRIELCAGLVEGGTTPSAGFLKAARRIFPGRIMMMIRPRGGDFLYSEAETIIMEEDIRLAAACGADGIVFGCLTADGIIDESLASRLKHAAAGLDCTFHRAFDVSRDLSLSLETLIRLGIPRVLTSGGKPGVMEALPILAALVAQAAGRISILPGGGIKAHDVAEVVRTTGVTECHLSARTAIDSPMIHRRPDIPMGALTVPGEYERRIANADLIRLARGV